MIRILFSWFRALRGRILVRSAAPAKKSFTVTVPAPLASAESAEPSPAW